MNADESDGLELSPKSYSDVAEMMRDLGSTDREVKKVKAAVNQSRIAAHLAKSRLRKGLTQKQLADALGVTQGTISKIESGNDADLTLKLLEDYCRVTEERMILTIGKKMTFVEAIKYHFSQIRRLFNELARLAHNHDELEPHISSFFGDAFFNLLHLLSDAQESLPKQSKVRECVEIQFLDKKANVADEAQVPAVSPDMVCR
ncbi:MAG: helix-turn-helix transcriptional regulator [Verrucomicrobia bacterium]|nr:helix-turn-helix transcriptional regulator [Verrucomicrobiota bacterium]